MELIKKPHMTYKSTHYNKIGKYAFIVSQKSNKIELKKQISSIYNVVITDIKTMNYLGESIVRYTRARAIKGKKNNYKKAIVTLRKGDVIDVHNETN